MCVCVSVSEKGRLAALFYRSLDQLTINSVTNNSSTDEKKAIQRMKQDLNKNNMLPASFSQTDPIFFSTTSLPLLTSIQTLSCLLRLLLSHRAWPSHNPWPCFSQTAHWFLATPHYTAPHVYNFMNQRVRVFLAPQKNKAYMRYHQLSVHMVYRSICVQTCMCWHTQMANTDGNTNLQWKNQLTCIYHQTYTAANTFSIS